MTVVVSWINAEPSEHASLAAALEYIAEHDGEVSFAVVVEFGKALLYPDHVLQDMLERRRREIEADRVHERSLVRFVMFGGSQ